MFPYNPFRHPTMGALCLRFIFCAFFALTLGGILTGCNEDDLVSAGSTTGASPTTTTTTTTATATTTTLLVVATPTIATIAPASGTASGGTVVTITGTNFTGGTSVTFGGTVATGLTILSATQLRVNSPAGVAGARDVSVTTPDGTATAINGFTYVPSTISTFAGSSQGLSGDGAAATAAQLNIPYGVALDGDGNLYIADGINNRIRVVCKTNGTYFGVVMTAGNIYTVAGTTSGLSGDGGAATAAKLNVPHHVAFDAAGNLYIADTGNHRIRMVAKADGTYFGVAMTANNIYTIAGTTSGLAGDGGSAISARLRNPVGIAFDAFGNLYIADSNNNRIRLVAKTNGTYFGVTATANNIYTLAGTTSGLSGDGASATAAQLSGPYGIAFDAIGNLYIADAFNNRVRVVAKANGTYFGMAMVANNIYTLAGTGFGFSGDGGIASSAQLGTPTDVAFDVLGNLYIAAANNDRIRMIPKTDGTYYGVVTTASNIYTIAGTGISSFSGDGGPATSAQLQSPNGIAFDSAGNLYIADTSNNRIRIVSP